jgi:hypothetical protein
MLWHVQLPSLTRRLPCSVCYAISQLLSLVPLLDFGTCACICHF